MWRKETDRSFYTLKKRCSIAPENLPGVKLEKILFYDQFSQLRLRFNESGFGIFCGI